MKVLKILLIILLLGIIGAAGGGFFLYKWASKDLPGFKKITDYNPPLVTTVYAKDNQVLGYFFKEKRFLVRLDEMGPYLPKAFLASEDASFYKHEGVDLTAIFRAFVINLKAGGIKQGGSTITQQIIKRLLLTSEKKYKRKLKEAILAYRLEHYLTKEEILTIYLNQIYLGARSYGVEAAARSYFGKHAKDLTLAESAIIAGLPQAPSRYNPLRHPELAKKRQIYVLGQMLNLGWISKSEHDAAVGQKLVYKSMSDPSWKVGAYYLEEVRRWLIDKFGEDTMYNGGLTVTTACDLKHQDAAEKAMRMGLEASARRRGWPGPLKNLANPADRGAFLKSGPQNGIDLVPGAWIQVMVDSVKKEGAKVYFGKYIGNMPVSTMNWCRTPDPKKATDEVKPVKDATLVLKKHDVVWAKVVKMPEKAGQPYELALAIEPVVEGALVSMKPDTGEVVALVGGYAFSRSQFNRATQAKRQPGSAFKPIVYSTALDNGYTPASTVLDAPIVFANDAEGKLWRPENFEGKFYGPTMLRTALVKSRNLCTIRVAQKIGIRKIVERAKLLGLETEFPMDLSVSLGSATVSLINLCEAYTAFARDGSTIRARSVLSVRSAWGEEMYSSKPEVKKAISPQTAYLVAKLMQHVVQHGTGFRAKVLKRPVAGKTGTTNNEQDAWYMGYSPYLLTGVFVGFDELKPMGKWETGSRAASPIWVEYRKQVEEDYPYQDFTQPPGVVMVKVDAETGKLAAPWTKESFFLPFKSGTQPTETARPPSGTTGAPASDDDIFKQVF